MLAEINEGSRIIPLRPDLGFMPSMWDGDQWAIPFAQFSKASGLTLSAYDTLGQRRIGPVIHHSLVQLVEQTGGWSEGGVCQKFESQLVADCLSSSQPISRYFEEALCLQVLPLEAEGTVAGVIVVGWTFDQFADPLRCARLSRAFGIPENIFWLAAREHSPVSRERFSTFVSLLKTMVNAILGQLSTLGEARHTNRIKDQFLATASHELKTPLTSMQLRVQMLRRLGVPSADQLQKGLAIIESGIKIQAKLVDDLLEASRVSTGKLRLEVAKLNPAELLQSAVETVVPGAEGKGVQVSLQIPPLLGEYRGDAGRLQQVFWNLLNNAVKFTPPGGFVAITARENAKQFVVEFLDSGRGLPRESLDHLFEPFYQVRDLKDETNKGLGLGLSVAKAIIDLHGGWIRATSEGPGKGATFTVSLPAQS